MTLIETLRGNAVGYQLRRWLADVLPADVSSGERLVALELADQANDDTRLAYGKDLLDIVARRTGFANPKQVGKVLTKLGARGLEMRVPVGKDRNGRSVFAYEGRQVTYRVPKPSECGLSEAPQAGEHSAQEVPQAGTSGPPAGTERSPARGQEVPPAGDPSPQISSSTPQKSLSQRPSTSEAMLAALGVEEREREVLIHKIEDLNNVKTFGWWINAWNNDTLAERLTEARAAVPSGSAHTTPPWCGKCSDPKKRQIFDEDQYGGGTRPRRCPDCHPSVVRQPPPRRPQNNGWDGPYLNPEDPATAYAGYRNDITDEELAAVANAAPL